MSIACWSVKGGAGTTVLAAALAVRAAARGDASLLVDLAGDAPAALGMAEPTGAGVAEWLAADDAPVDGLGRLEIDAGSLHVLPRGRGVLDAGRAELLAAVLAADHRSVILDCGTMDPEDPSCDARRILAGGATESWLVTRPCYLALRRFTTAAMQPSGVALVTEPGRSLGPGDVEDVVGAPVVLEVPWHEAISRSVDAGLLGSRLPRVLDRAVRGA